MEIELTLEKWLNNNFEYEVISCKKEKDGNFICLTVKTTSITFNILTLYGPNSDDPQFFTNVKSVVQENNPNYYVIRGDFNLVINKDIDYSNYLHINNPRATLEVLSMLEELDLINVYHSIHSETCRYTWRIANPIKQAQIFFLYQIP